MLECAIVLEGSVWFATEIEIRRFANILGDVVSSMAGGLDLAAFDVVRITGDLVPGNVQPTPVDPFGLGNDMQVRMPFVIGAKATTGSVRAGEMKRHFDDSVARSDGGLPMLPLPQATKAGNESGELLRQRRVGVLKRECVELPFEIGSLIHEVEHAGSRPTLNVPAACGADA